MRRKRGSSESPTGLLIECKSVSCPFVVSGQVGSNEAIRGTRASSARASDEGFEASSVDGGHCSERFFCEGAPLQTLSTMSCRQIAMSKRKGLRNLAEPSVLFELRLCYAAIQIERIACFLLRPN
jgi:hypothetical protein